MSKKSGKNKEDIEIVIWDSKSGNWELNKLMFPLINDYNTGMCSVTEIKARPGILTMEYDPENYGYLKGQKWYFYIWFGFKLGLKLLFRKIYKFIK